VIHADGRTEWLSLPVGLVLGIMPDVPYQTFTTTLNAGDLLLTYTDGVTEAKSVDSKLYSDDKLLALAEAHRRETAAEIVGTVMRSVKEHAKAAPQSDDITILALSFAGITSDVNRPVA
jgi:sigma-B regulation protein RsbU (phosphoserine phosphatase)